jgi:hypothetical protein
MFCSLTTVKTDQRKLAMGKQLESSVTMVVVTFGGASAPKTAQAVAEMAGVLLQAVACHEKLRRGGSMARL